MAYNVHLNGRYHASIRYSELAKIRERIAAEFGRICDFPPKRLLSHALSNCQLEKRRAALERYLRRVLQFQEVANHEAVTSFFLRAQLNSFDDVKAGVLKSVKLQIHTLYGGGEFVDCDVASSSKAVLKSYCSKIGMCPANGKFFSLFIGKENSLVHWLQPFEAPYISLRSYRNESPEEKFDLYIAKCVWNYSLESELLSDAAATRLLYKQAKFELESQILSENDEVRTQFALLENGSKFAQCVALCQRQRYYGFWNFPSCRSDYAGVMQQVQLKFGYAELILTFNDAKTNKRRQAVFAVDKIRTWKIINEEGEDYSQQFKIEHVVSSSQSEWVTIFTNEATLMCQILQAIIAEVMSSVKGLRTPSWQRKYSLSSSVATTSSVLTNGTNSSGMNGSFDNITDDDL